MAFLINTINTSITCFKGLVSLEIKSDTCERPHRGRDTNDETSHAQNLKSEPCPTPTGDFLLSDVHLDREIDRKRPKSERSEYPNNVIKERHEHCDKRRQHHEDRPPNEAEEIELEDAEEGDRNVIFGGDEVTLRPLLGAPFLDEGKQWLTKDLAR